MGSIKLIKREDVLKREEEQQVREPQPLDIRPPVSAVEQWVSRRRIREHKNPRDKFAELFTQTKIKG